MAVDPVIRERSRALNAAHTAWALGQVAAGVDGPTPADRPNRDESDYNQHVPDLEASGAAEDAFHERARAIMGL